MSSSRYSASTARPSASVTAAKTNEIKIYPNPSHGQFQISFPAETADVVIFNSTGKEVLRKKVANHEVINLNNAESGLYFISISTEKENFSQKIVLK